MTTLSRGALALMLVLAPGIASAIPMPPLAPAASESPSVTGGPRRVQVMVPIDEETLQNSAEVGGPRRPGAISPGS